MTGNACADVPPVLPMNARTLRIASGGGLVASTRGFPAGATRENDIVPRVRAREPYSFPNGDPTKPFTITEPSYEGETHEQSTDDWT